MLEPKPEHEVYRFAYVKTAMVFALVEEIPVTVLGDAALTAARRLQEASEILIRLCSWIIYVLGALSLELGLFAAITGLKSEGAE